MNTNRRFSTELIRHVHQLPHPGTLHVAAWHSGNSDDRALLHERDQLPAGSLIKVPIMATLLDLCDRGRLRLDERVAIPPLRVGGSGVLQALPSIGMMTLAELMTLMIIVSDNVATNVILDVVGMSNVDAYCEKLGLEHTRMRRTMMDVLREQRGITNTTSALDQCVLLEALARGLFRSTELNALAIHTLGAQQLNCGLSERLGSDVRVAHKTGVLREVCHDAGIITDALGRQLIIAVLVGNLQQPAQSSAELIEAHYSARSVISSIGKAAVASAQLSRSAS